MALELESSLLLTVVSAWLEAVEFEAAVSCVTSQVALVNILSHRNS